MKERMLAGALALTLCLTLLAGCGGETPPPAPSDEPKVESTLFQSGAVEDKTYTNATLGLGCTLDDDWTFASDEEIAATFGTAMELLDEAETGLDLSDVETFTDLYVYTTDGLKNINVQVQKLGALVGSAVKLTDEEELVDSMLPVLEQALNSAYAPAATVTCQKTDATFLDETHKAVSMVTTVGDVELYQKQVYIPLGLHIATVTCTSVNTDMTDELLALFYAV